VSDPEYERYVDKDGKRRVRRRKGDEVCDFCLKPHPTWSYPAAPMEIVGHHAMSGSDDEWAACDECHALIEAHNLGGLVERVVAMQPVHRPADDVIYYPPVPVARRKARQNLLRFMDARTGPPTAEPPRT
jgi:hypothetical protein